MTECDKVQGNKLTTSMGNVSSVVGGKVPREGTASPGVAGAAPIGVVVVCAGAALVVAMS